MALNIKGATQTSYTKYQVFNGYRILVITHDPNVLSQYPKVDPETKEESPKYQAFTTIIPLEDGQGKHEDGPIVSWTAGEVHKSFIDGARIRPQLMEVDTPVLGKLGKGKPGKKGGKPWLLLSPTDEDYALLETVSGLEETVEKVISDAKGRKVTSAPVKSVGDDAEQVSEEVAEPGESPWKK